MQFRTTGVAVGQLAVSKRGRDRGEPYLVLEIIDEDFVYLINGDKRRIENPKRKNIKHLLFYPAVAEHLAQQWEAGQQVSNIEIRKVIAGFLKTQESGVRDQESGERTCRRMPILLDSCEGSLIL